MSLLIPPPPQVLGKDRVTREEAAKHLIRIIAPKLPKTRRTAERTEGGLVINQTKPVYLRSIPVSWGLPFDEIVFTRWVTHILHSRMLMPWDDTITMASTYITEARNTIHQQFVRDCETDWLVMLDSDVLPPPDFVERLMKHNKPVATGWYKKKGEPYLPCVYDFAEEDGKGIAWWKERQEAGTGLEQVDGIGAGCILMRRDAATALGERPYSPNVVSEDFFLCRKLHELGIPITLDWSIACAHTGVALV